MRGARARAIMGFPGGPAQRRAPGARRAARRRAAGVLPLLRRRWLSGCAAAVADAGDPAVDVHAGEAVGEAVGEVVWDVACAAIGLTMEAAAGAAGIHPVLQSELPWEPQSALLLGSPWAVS